MTTQNKSPKEPLIKDESLKSSIAWSTTGALINFLERTLNVELITEGLENISDSPTLFVVNHFTRSETFILPYILHKYRNENPRSLAHHSLFSGTFGRYLKRLGTVSTKEPLRNRLIIGDLMTGRKNWVIYPEGTMVKNKKFMNHGKFHIETPGYSGSPKTGGAVLAIKASLYRKDYLDAYARGDEAKVTYYQDRYHFSSIDDLSDDEIVITPVNITYYPIRPRENKVSKLAQALIKDLPENVEEELMIEGRILLGKTDMSVYFCPPIGVGQYLKPQSMVGKWIDQFVRPSQRISLALKYRRKDLTRRFMGQIYTNVEVNFDHLFCYGLHSIANERIDKSDFHNALLLTALELEEQKLCRIHKSLAKDCARIVLGLPYPPLENVMKEVTRERCLLEEENEYVINRDLLNESIEFQDIRLRLTSKVIANEFEPLTTCADRLERNVNLSSETLRLSVSQALERLETFEYKADYQEYFDEEHSKPEEVGEPFHLCPPSPKAGVLLIHGYLAAPMEMRQIGELLYEAGYAVYGVRLKGHGTSPKNIAEVTSGDWIQSVTTGYGLLHNRFEKVFIVGFSMGGLLGLIKSADLSEHVAGVASINAALKVNDNRAQFAGAAVAWNGMLGKLNIGKARFEHIDNKPSNPEINYSKNYISGVHQLSETSDLCLKKLKAIECPALILQSANDTVVNPDSAMRIYNAIGSAEKDIKFIDTDSHVIVTDEHLETVFRQVADFLDALSISSDSLGTNPYFY